MGDGRDVVPKDLDDDVVASWIPGHAETKFISKAHFRYHHGLRGATRSTMGSQVDGGAAVKYNMTLLEASRHGAASPLKNKLSFQLSRPPEYFQTA